MRTVLGLKDAPQKTILREGAIPASFTVRRVPEKAAVSRVAVTEAKPVTGRLSQVRTSDQVKILLIPGRVLKTEAGCFLILHVLGQGGAGLVLLVRPLHMVARVNDNLDLSRFGSPDVYDFLENDLIALQEWKDLELPKRVLKVSIAPPHTAQGRAADDALRNEALCLSSLTMSATPFFIDTGSAPLPWMISEYIIGNVLGTAIKDWYGDGRNVPFAWSQMYRIIRGTAVSLLGLHEEDVLHLDVKPDNIFFRLGAKGRDVVRLIDLGLGTRHLPEGLEHLLEDVEPKAHRPAGAPSDCTPEFAPPEQIAGHQIGAKADVYALTGTLYACLTGRPPFQFNPARSTRDAMLAALLKIYQEKEAVTEHGVAYLTHPHLGGAGNPTPPQRTLNQLLRRGLEPNPFDRLGLEAFVELLEEVERQRVVLARPQRRASDRGVRNGAVTLTPQSARVSTHLEDRLEHSRAVRRVKRQRWTRTFLRWGAIILLLFVLLIAFQVLSPIVLEKIQPILEEITSDAGGTTQQTALSYEQRPRFP